MSALGAVLLAACGQGTLEEGTGDLVGAPETGEHSLSQAPAGTYVRANQPVNLRTGPSTGHTILRVVPVGTLGKVRSGTAQSGFLELEVAGQVGWSYGLYWDAQTLIRATAPADMRSGPGADQALLWVAQPGEAAILSGDAGNGWIKLQSGRYVAYSPGALWDGSGAKPSPDTASKPPSPAPVSMTVNGRTLTPREDTWVRYVASKVVANLRGDRQARLETAARVTWWALKEGVLDLENPIAYSNCNTVNGDVRLGAFDVCWGERAWQVGLSGVQVPGRTLAVLEALALERYPGKTVAEVLGLTAREAGYALGSWQHNSVVSSSGELRRSWLLRNSTVGFTLQEPTVTYECITNAYRWCYSTAWDTSSWYAPNRAAALGSIEDLRRILAALAP